MGKRGKIFVKNLLKVILSTLLCFLLLEGYFRLFRPQTEMRVTKTTYLPPCFMYDPVISWTLYPGIRVIHHAESVFGRPIPVRINSKGFRDEEFPAEETAGRTRIVALGDSFVFGLGVLQEEGVAKQLEELLGKESYRVINAGYVGGMSLDTMYLALKNRILGLHPHFLLLFYFEGNDLRELSLSVWPERDQKGLPLRVLTAWNVIEEKNTLWMGRHIQKLSRSTRLFKFWADHSHLGRFLYDRYRRRKVSEEDKKSDEAGPAGRKSLVLKRLSSGQEEKLLLDLIREMARLCRNSGTGIAVVMIPSREQTSDRARRHTNLRLRRELEKSGIRVLDLLENWPRGDQSAPYYFPGDRFGHWNPAGHKLAAATIAEYLRAVIQR